MVAGQYEPQSVGVETVFSAVVLAPWAHQTLGLQSALVTGTGSNQATLPRLRKDLASILTAFAPRAKERPEDIASDGDLDLLIATDCISEGQNLQDCDCLINYDIHWNPVRIIQRFGRIDRIGSPNERIQLVNFWPIWSWRNTSNWSNE